jgi:C4-dicarboxylate-specific signal transduction histidine kinase
MEPLEALRQIRRLLHELSQPLAAAAGLIDLLLLELPREGKFSQDLQLVNQQLGKVLEIVAQIRRVAVEASQAA